MLKTKGPALTVLVLAQILALSLWFSATATIPALRREFALDNFTAALMTSAVQAGFVAGTLASAFLGLADRLEPRRLFAASALLAAVANALILALPADLITGSLAIPLLRFVTGVAMAGIYPVGMKLAATWSVTRDGRSDLGRLVGLLVGALTFGSALPHLFNAVGGVDWRMALAATSIAALCAAGLILLMAIGPATAATRVFHMDHVLDAWRQSSLRLANVGYLGHMWELYAMWAWIVTFLQASFTLNPGPAAVTSVELWARVSAFLVIAAGAVGCVAGGWLADRWGRTTLTIGALTVSGLCSLTVGLLFGGNPWLLMLVCLIWGASIVADSAQFSASVTELSAPELIGTMLTIQTCAGFLLTLVTIHLTPVLVDLIGWKYGFAFLALGPVVGICAMARLRQSPDAVKLAAGRR
ncbi:MAG TPA: MFS transporter [Dongiaceae bacterium]|jgi:MFS family permease